MHWLLFASGLISLTFQALFQRLVSLSAGDLYTTFAFTSLVFIVGSAVGSFLGPFFRKQLCKPSALKNNFQLCQKRL